MLLAAGISVAVAVGVAGCGEARQLTAKQQVSQGLSAFEKANSASFTVRLNTTPADYAAIAAAQGEPVTASDKRNLAAILAGQVLFDIQEPDGKTFGDAAKSGSSASGLAGQSDLTKLLDDPAALSAALKKSGAFSASVQSSGQSLFDVRSIDGVIYFRADLAKILKLAGENPAELNHELASLPPSMSSLAAAAKGKWVSIDLIKAAKAAKSSGLLNSLKERPTPTPTVSVDPAKVQKLLTDLKAAYQQKATIASIGNDPAKGNGYRLSAPAKQVAEAISGDLVAIAGPKSADQVRQQIAKIPNKSFSLDLWVKDDKLTAVSLDLVQFLDKPVPGKKLALDVGIEIGGGSVSAPSGATEIDVAALLRQLPAGGLPGMAGTTGAPPPPGTAGKLTKEQRKMLKDSGLTDAQIKKLIAAQKASDA